MQQIFLSSQATEPKVASRKKIACTFCSTKFSRVGLKRLTLRGSHLVSSVDTAYVHSLNLLLMLPSLHSAPPMPECEIVDIVPAEGGLFILHKGKKKQYEHCFFTRIRSKFPAQKSALKRKIFFMNFHEDSWKTKLFMIWMMIMNFSPCQETTDQP